MRLATRKLLDRSFSSIGIIAIAIMGISLLVILVPIFWQGSHAFVFKGTVEHRRLLMERFDRGNPDELKQELIAVAEARKPVYDIIHDFESQQQSMLDNMMPTLELLAKQDGSIGRRVTRSLRKIKKEESFTKNVKTISKLVMRLKDSIDSVNIKNEISVLEEGIKHVEHKTESLMELKEAVAELLGPPPGSIAPALPRKQYGSTRWEHAENKLYALLYTEQWDYSGDGLGHKTKTLRAEQFKGTKLEKLFEYIENNVEAMLLPKTTFYWGFITDSPLDIHIFGGIFPELIGTIYLTICTILFAMIIGIIAAIYFSEYARPGKVVSFLRTCISTLAGVPSIVFGMFGLALFLNVFHMPKGVLAGSLTLALLILPTIIRSAEEAIRAVPNTYREAALGLGAGRWHTVITIILPAALPGILTGMVISMGRAAGETAPIIFTAAATVAATLSLNPLLAWNQPTPALSWNIYNLCTEHEAANEIRHVQFGMLTVLILIVLILNFTAIIIRARIAKKAKG